MRLVRAIAAKAGRFHPSPVGRTPAALAAVLLLLVLAGSLAATGRNVQPGVLAAGSGVAAASTPTPATVEGDDVYQSSIEAAASSTHRTSPSPAILLAPRPLISAYPAVSLTVSGQEGRALQVSDAAAQAAVGGGTRPTGGAGGLVPLAAIVVLSAIVCLLAVSMAFGRARARSLALEQSGLLRHQSLHDPLTGLPNRSLTCDRIDQMLARSRRHNRTSAVILIDLDDFKEVNDALGHTAGDQLLVKISERLSATLRKSETLGRMGEDEFAVLVEGDTADTSGEAGAGPEIVADRMMKVLEAPFHIAASPIPLSIFASMGIADGQRRSCGELLRDADIALYRAKNRGKGCSVAFAQSMQTAAQDHRHLSLDLHGALEAGQFFLVYQPTISLETNAITGVEALLRWRHPERGVVEPSVFIPTLEASGLIVPVGAWVLESACRQGAMWQSQGNRFTVSVNVSAKQFALHRIVADVKEALSRTGFDPTLLALEMTESTLMNNVQDTIGRFALLKALGLHLAVDDFGTGYSSLAYLQLFPIDILKIDRSFVSGIGSSSESTALVQMLVQLGKALNLEIVAEGIEDDVQRDFLRAEKVHTGQGYLFSRPLETTEIDRFIHDVDAIGPAWCPARSPVDS